jgi:hypothetical protein
VTRTKFLTAAVACLFLASLGLSAPASAALIDCGPSGDTDLTGKVTDTGGTSVAVDDCQYIDPPSPSNVASEGNINAAGFFGFSDWDIWVASVGQVSVNASSGTWSIPDVDFGLYDYIIVFKDGAATNLTAFSFNELFASGDWTTPFTDPPFNFPGMSTSHDVSHYSLARRLAPEETPVPEPGSIALIGLALLMLTAVGRRTRQ